MFVILTATQGIEIYILLDSIDKKSIGQTNLWILKIIYLAGIITVLFIRNIGVVGVELNPMVGLIHALQSRYDMLVLILNVLLFIPMAAVIRLRKRWQEMVVALFVILLLESLQCFLGRGIFDTLDVIMNWFGFVIGQGLVYLVKKRGIKL